MITASRISKPPIVLIVIYFFVFISMFGCDESIPSNQSDLIDASKCNKASNRDTLNTVLKEGVDYFGMINSRLIRCYESIKVDSLARSSSIYNPKKIDSTTFHKLTAKEHFIHSFHYMEWYIQSCGTFPVPDNILQVIPAYLMRGVGGLQMSPRQRSALANNRDSTVILMRDCIERTGEVPDKFKRYIIDASLFELIPTLIKTLEGNKDFKDPYIVTVLCNLMHLRYKPFTQSEIYRELYQEDNDKETSLRLLHQKSIPFTRENYLKIIEFAKGYYQERMDAKSTFTRVPSGKYFVGQKGHSINPYREVDLEDFYISRYEVTNNEFKKFVDQTGYITVAEKNKDAFVFRLGLDEFEWIQDSTANWRYPNGKSRGGITDKMDHPVTCICFKDAMAYCEWSGKTLPTIEQWEVASRGGQPFREHFFGDSTNLIHLYANIWHGQNHLKVSEDEQFMTTRPVGTLEPNPFGLFDIYGNVFEFCSNIPDAFQSFEHVASTRGGSWWCSKHACNFFNSVDIGRVRKEASFSNNGFRVVTK